jgi:hypothetical protein
MHGHSPAEDGRFLHQDVEVVFAAHLAVPLMHRAFKAAGSFPGHLEHKGRDMVTRPANIIRPLTFHSDDSHSSINRTVIAMETECFL